MAGPAGVVRRTPDPPPPEPPAKIISQVWNVQGRPVVVVEFEGRRKAFYRRDADSSRPEGHGGPKVGDWAPFDGWQESRRSPGEGHFIKENYHRGMESTDPLHGYGNQKNKDVADWLKGQNLQRPAAEQHWTEVQAEIEKLGVKVRRPLPPGGKPGGGGRKGGGGAGGAPQPEPSSKEQAKQPPPQEKTAPQQRDTGESTKKPTEPPPAKKPTEPPPAKKAAEPPPAKKPTEPPPAKKTTEPPPAKKAAEPPPAKKPPTSSRPAAAAAAAPPSRRPSAPMAALPRSSAAASCRSPRTTPRTRRW
jgi:hypothetical protein